MNPSDALKALDHSLPSHLIISLEFIHTFPFDRLLQPSTLSTQPTMAVEEVKHADIECVEQSSQLSIDVDEEKALVRKIDLYLLPTIWIM
jgi:hypothetical protein